MTKDPDCGMTVGEILPERGTHAGQFFVFFNPAYKASFDGEPPYCPVACCTKSRKVLMDTTLGHISSVFDLNSGAVPTGSPFL